MKGREKKNEPGFTLLEMIIVLAVLSLVTVATIPVARNMAKHSKEKELRRTLIELRKSIDAYKISCEQGNVGPLDRKIEDECFPPTLEILVEGIHPPNKGDVTLRFMRRIPKDPLTDKADWGLRSVQDDPDSTSWGGQNVYNVFSKAQGTPLDKKSQYKEW